ncbi:hypothetical protein C8R31_10868 [Nitrosospira sp. Nsp2]|nr:hypothetical protein C8R31_10868 [Nitrosospira sp. Nsp2]
MAGFGAPALDQALMCPRFFSLYLPHAPTNVKPANIIAHASGSGTDVITPISVRGGSLGRDYLNHPSRTR